MICFGCLSIIEVKLDFCLVFYLILVEWFGFGVKDFLELMFDCVREGKVLIFLFV